GKKAAVPSTFAIQPVTLSSWLLQQYGVAVGSLSEDSRHTVESRWLRVENLLGCCDEVLIAAENDGLRSFAGPDLAESHGFQFRRLRVQSDEIVDGGIGIAILADDGDRRMPPFRLRPHRQARKRKRCQ